MQKKIKILSTRPLEQATIEEAAAENIAMDVLSFIETIPIKNEEIVLRVREVAVIDTTVVFTSMNAVESVKDMLEGERPWWTIYCIGETTGTLVMDYFGAAAIAGTANNATALAALIMLDGVKEIVFFCGDNRRPELPATLTANEVQVEELIVYSTRPTPQTVTDSYDAILFFSPSAVESFFLTNSTRNNTLFFAIGETTADSVRKFTNNPIITGVIPGKEMLAQQAIEYFRALEQSQ